MTAHTSAHLARLRPPWRPLAVHVAGHRAHAHALATAAMRRLAARVLRWALPCSPARRPVSVVLLAAYGLDRRAVAELLDERTNRVRWWS